MSAGRALLLLDRREGRSERWEGVVGEKVGVRAALHHAGLMIWGSGEHTECQIVSKLVSESVSEPVRESTRGGVISQSVGQIGIHSHPLYHPPTPRARLRFVWLRW